MVLGLKPMGKPTTLKKEYKFWTEPRPCMVLGLKPMGKPTTLKKNYKFWTEPRPCMVLELKPIEKPTTLKKEYKFWAEPRPCMDLGLKPMGKPITTKKTYKFWTQPGTIIPRSSDQRPGVIENTAKVPHYSATLSDGLFWVSHSRATTSRALWYTQLLSRLVS